jgi:DNA (cytosine-5)-methyltransferase 1
MPSDERTAHRAVGTHAPSASRITDDEPGPREIDYNGLSQPPATDCEEGPPQMADARRNRKTPRQPPRAFTAAEFFAGIGLVRLALESEGWHVAFANDIDANKQRMYVENFGRDDFHLGDIHHLSADDLPTCDLFTASFPCNDLSIAGARQGLHGKESSAFFGLTNLLEHLADRKSPLVLLENVVGFLQSHGGADFETAMLKLNDLGYNVDAFILNAMHWVPQSRARLFVVASMDRGEDRNAFTQEGPHRTRALADFINLHQNIRWNIRRLPRLPQTRRRLADIIEDLPEDDSHWWNQERADYFMGQLNDRHLVQAKLMIAQDTYSYATAFRRIRKGRSMAELRVDGIAGCLRTPRGGSGRQILFRGGKGGYRVRLLTARECARLQGVPDSYRLDGIPLNQALFGFGDAVCVPAVRWIVRHYLTPLAEDHDTSSNLFTQDGLRNKATRVA